MQIKWTRKSLEEFLKGKNRTITVEEYLLLIDFINKIRPETFIDIGTYLGASGYILGTCCNSITKVVSVDNTLSQTYTPKEEATIEEHGKFLTKETIFITEGYENTLSNIITDSSHTFILWDAGKNTLKVMDQLKRSWDLKIRWIAFHDSGTEQATVRRAIKRAERFGWYKIVTEDIVSCPSKGVSILELIE